VGKANGPRECASDARAHDSESNVFALLWWARRRTRSRPAALPTLRLLLHWDEIDAPCKLNGVPFNATGEKIRDGGLWSVYEFTWQLDAMQFWDRFEGRWLRGTEFHFPGRPKDLPAMKPLKNWPTFDREKQGTRPFERKVAP
jgi:hypothetical protein